MQRTEYKLNERLFENFSILEKRFIQEVLAETKYSEPLICPRKLEAWAKWKFAQYVKTN